jgi:signal transduction histidine kinase
MPRRLRPIPGAWWWLPLGLLLVLLVLANWVTPTWREVRELRLGDWQATRCVPSAGVEWKPVTPPLGLTGDCWLLRTAFDRPELGLEGGMLMLAGAHQDAGVTINGVQVRNADVGGFNSFSSGVLWLPLATGLLQTGENELLLELRSRSASVASPVVYLRSAHIGPTRLMETFQMRHQWLHAFGAQSTLILLGAMLLFLLPIAVVRPRESLYRWFALALIGSAIYVSNFATVWRPLSLLTWGALIHLSLILATWALVRCSAALRSEAAPRWTAWLAGIAACAVVFEALWWPRPGIALVSVMMRVLILAQVLGLVVWWWQRRDGPQVPSGRWFAAAMALLAVLGVLDTLRVMQREVWTTPGYLLHWGILYVALLLFVVLLLRILQGLRQAEQGRAELAVALAARERELLLEFQRRQEAESARTLADERMRIMRDMHDGVGGQLVALIGQMQAGQVDAAVLAPQLRRTLDDLRLMIDSLDSACADLSVALGMLRARMAPLLAGQPVKVIWRTAQLPDLPAAPPATVLHVLRVLQEALTNALRHSGASEVLIEAEWDGTQLSVAVLDNGRWREHAAGRGLASMRRRASEVGGELKVAAGEGGTAVRLRLPLGS